MLVSISQTAKQNINKHRQQCVSESNKSRNTSHHTRQVVLNCIA